ncbi:von Willebrand factor type A domain-containing protein [Parafrankia irregularis]|uniref:von Willebrand factor type A domain-containing protein n=1 Tax=Parafrankia irregularis TaxID=795642 RepID=A0A0S4QX32_9ACTN|nr:MULTISPECIES: VWA domain-containing protein [Parafrankia]MBE3202786.1 VWA domain-containing protein [Parafrankia sp. CH37]CUU60051.1 von Willebrand factor type A domain-containing protein [Parafrankia irregularis]
MIEFTVRVDRTLYLQRNETKIDALLTVTTNSRGSAGPGPGTYAEVIIIDCSGSMAYPNTKIAAARRAAAAAVDALQEGAHFAVIAGTGHARPVYPRDGMAVASNDTRGKAKEAISRLSADGGTAMGSWLRLARTLLARRPEAVRHAIMLTDGRNESETAQQFADAVEACEGHFQCDCRGIGKGWVAADLRLVATRLLGTASPVVDPAGLVDDFRAVVRRAMSRAVNEVSLRVWTPRGATVQLLKQTAPTIEDLTGRGVRSDALAIDYPTGAWGLETRDYYVVIDGLRPIVADQPSRAGRVGMVVGGTELDSAGVRVQWTDDPYLFTEISERVAESTGQLELARAIQEGIAALRAGDTPKAEAALGPAVRLAHQSGNQRKLRELGRLVEIQDPVAGEVRVRSGVTAYDLEVSELQSWQSRDVGAPDEEIGP